MRTASRSLKSAACTGNHYLRCFIVAIKEVNVAKGVNVLTKQRSQTIEGIDELLLIWINQKQLEILFRRSSHV